MPLRANSACLNLVVVLLEAQSSLGLRLLALLQPWLRSEDPLKVVTAVQLALPLESLDVKLFEQVCSGSAGFF